VLDIEIQSNPYDLDSWVDVAAVEDERSLARVRVTGQARLAVPLDAPFDAVRRVELRVVDAHPGASRSLPAFECRDTLEYRVLSARLRPPAPAEHATKDSGRRGWRRRAAEGADAAGRTIAALLGRRLTYRVARAAPEFEAVEKARRTAEQQLRELAPLRYLGDLEVFLRDRRPRNLHVNSCGDFQLMAREHWDALRGYPELETFSMNIDGLLSYMADAAGIKEQILAEDIYHLEHEVGSGWSPEGEAILRRRIAERGITWLDASTVYIWAAYMTWLRRPMIFNRSDWGFANDSLVEHEIAASSGSIL